MTSGIAKSGCTNKSFSESERKFVIHSKDKFRASFLAPVSPIASLNSTTFHLSALVGLDEVKTFE